MSHLKGDPVKYFKADGTHTDSEGRPYHKATVITQSGKDDFGNKIYIITPEYSEYERIVVDGQIEKL